MPPSISEYLHIIKDDVLKIERSLISPFYQIDRFIEENDEIEYEKIEKLDKKRMKLAKIITVFYSFKELVEEELGEKLADIDKEFNPDSEE